MREAFLALFRSTQYQTVAKLVATCAGELADAYSSSSSDSEVACCACRHRLTRACSGTSCPAATTTCTATDDCQTTQPATV